MREGEVEEAKLAKCLSILWRMIVPAEANQLHEFVVVHRASDLAQASNVTAGIVDEKDPIDQARRQREIEFERFEIVGQSYDGISPENDASWRGKSCRQKEKLRCRALRSRETPPTSTDRCDAEFRGGVTGRF